MSGPIDYASPGTMKPAPKAGRWKFGWVLFIAVAIALIVALRNASPKEPSMPLSDFYAQVKAGNISAMTIDGDSIDGQFRAPVLIGTIPASRFRAELPAGTAGNWIFTQWLLEAAPHTTVRAEPANSLLTNFILPLIPWLLILGFIWWLVSRISRRNNRQPMPVIIVNPEVR